MNNLYTLSYFRKRLLQEGYTSKILIKDYEKEDVRYWTISIDPKLKILCTCYKFLTEDGENVFFEFWDGYNKIKMRQTLNTKSMNVIINYLDGIRTTE